MEGKKELSASPGTPRPSYLRVHVCQAQGGFLLPELGDGQEERGEVQARDGLGRKTPTEVARGHSRRAPHV